MTGNLRMGSRRVKTLLLGILAAISLALGTTPAHAERVLGHGEIVLYGLGLKVEPERQVVPKNIATVVSAYLQAPVLPGQVSPLPADAVVRATLTGPSFAAPKELTARPNEPLPVPPLTVPGIHLVENVRLEAGGEVLLYGSPESVVVEVIEKLLVTEITARALTAEEIRAKGIVFDRSNFQAYNFTAAFAVGAGEPVQVSFPVVLPNLAQTRDVAVSTAEVPSLKTSQMPSLATVIPDTLKFAVQIPNLSVQGFQLKAETPAGQAFEVPPIPGVVVIPGDVGFLSQYFSVMLMVGNAAPSYANLTVTDLRAELVLPSGRDTVAGTADDPLTMARLEGGESPRVRPITRPGPDGVLGTADDVAALGPGESGNAEFLVEGRREGTHTVEMEIAGTLLGLPIGPVPVRGRAAGAVLVRNPTFTLTFTHPDVVAAGEPYQLDVTVTNTSESPANFVRVSLFPRYVSGATVVGEPTREVETIPPGDSASMTFDLLSRVSGKVFAATLDSDENVAGRFQLKTSVGELGVPVSPDSLVLPKEAGALPKTLREAALGLLGRAYAVATAPAGALPKDVARFSKKVVFDRAVETAEAGFRLSLGEPLPDGAAQLLFDFAGSNYGRLAERAAAAELPFLRKDVEGFDALRRRSVRGDVFARVVADLLASELVGQGAEGFHRALAEKVSYRPAHLSVLLSAPGPLPFTLTLVDGQGRRLGGADAAGKVVKEIPFGDLLPFGDSGQLAVLTAPAPGDYRLELRRNPAVAEDAPFELSLVVPGPSGALRQLAFAGLTGAQAPTLAFGGGDPCRVTVELVGVPVPAAAAAPSADLVLTDPAPTVLGAVQQPEADKVSTECGTWRFGRVAAVLFSEEVTPESVQDKVDRARITNFSAEENQVVGVSLQPGRRIAFLAFRDPIGPFVTRSLAISGAADGRGQVMDPWTGSVEATIEDPGAVLSGRILQPDGAAAEGAEVRLFTQIQVPSEDGCESSWYGIGSKRSGAGGAYGWDWIPLATDKLVAIDPATEEFRSVPFTAARDGQRLNVDVVFLGRGTLTGRAFAQDGTTPLEGAVVRVTSLTDQNQSRAITDRNGRYTAPRVPVGNLLIEAVHGATNAKTVQSDHLGQAGATVTRDLVLFRQDSEDLIIRRAVVSGHVLRSDGATPAAGLPVVVYYQSRSQPGVACPTSPGAPEPRECPVAVATTDAAGAFAFPGVPAGTLRAYAFEQASLQEGEARADAPADQETRVNVLLSGGLGTVRGVVLDGAGNPVAGASVGGGLSLTTTDANGEFVLTDVPVGTRQIVASSQALGVIGLVVVNLTTAGETVGSTIVLPSTGTLTGRVVRADGTTPVSGLPIYVIKGDTLVVATGETDGQGAYRIGQIPLGQYRLSAFLPDLSDGNLAPVAIQTSGQVVAADVRFKGRGRVTGVVLNDDGVTPLAARVSVSGLAVVAARGPGGTRVGLGFQHVQHLQIQDSNLSTGRFQFENVFVGPFVVTAAGAFSPDPVAFAGELRAAGETAEVILRLTPTSQVRGTVYEPDGVTPVGAGVSVTFHSDEFRTVCTESGGEVVCRNVAQGIQEEIVVTDDSGRYWVPVVNAGKFTVTAEDFATGKKAQATALVQGGAVAEVPLRLVGLGSVAVHVYGSDGVTPVPGARVDLEQTAFPWTKKTALADARGSVAFEGGDALTEGPFVVIARDLRNGFAGRAAGKISFDGEALSLNVYLFDASGAVYGTVFRPDGATPVPTAEVRLSTARGPIAFAVTDGQGAYRVETVPLGPFSVAVFEAATGRRGAGSARVDRDRQEVPLNVVETGLALVRGTVLSAADFSPLAGWSVTLSQAGLSLQGTTGVDGAFSFPGVPVGSFLLAASGDRGYAQGAGRITREGEVTEIPLLARLVQRPEGDVQGWVFRADGTPAPDAQVRLGLTGRAATTGSDGSFRFAGVPLGRYAVLAGSQISADLGSSQVELAFAGETAFTWITLAGVGTVAGTARWAADGSPAGRVQVVLEKAPEAGCGSDRCTTYADDQGRFQFRNVPSGTFTVTARDPVSLLAGATGGTLTPGGTADVAPYLELSATMTALVVSTAGAPVRGVVAALAIGGRTLYLETDGDGRFTFGAVPLGAYALELRDPIGPGLARRTGSLADVGIADLGTIVLDEGPPSVASLQPAPGAVGVALDATVRIVFSERVRQGTLTAANVQVIGPSGPLSGTLTPSGGDAVVTFAPLSPLAQQTRYTVRVRGVEDALGRPMAAEFVSTFTAADLTPPAVADASPAPGAGGVPLDSVIRIRFSEPVDPAGFAGPALTLATGVVAVAGRVDLVLGNTVAVFTPERPLSEATTYHVAALPARDLAGNTQAAGLAYDFSTTDRTPPGIDALVLSGGGQVIQGGTGTVAVQLLGVSDVAFVDFSLNGVLAGTARTAPFAFSFAAVAALGVPGQTVAVSAVATDTSGNRGAPVSGTFTIVADAPPTVSIVSPAAGATAATGARVSVTVQAFDDLGVARVAWQAPGAAAPSSGQQAFAPAGSSASAEFSFVVPAGALPGSVITVRATAVDTGGQATEAAPVAVTVLDAAPPVVAFSGLTTGARVRPGETVTAVVSASDAGGIAAVSFQAAGVVVRSETRAVSPAQPSVVTSFSVTVPAAATSADRLTLSASARDAAGNAAQAAAVILPVADVVPPTVTLRTQGGSLEAPAGQDVVVLAEAADEVGVTRVDLAGAGALVFSDSRAVSPPQASATVSFTVRVPESAAAGSQLSLTARAHDEAGNASAQAVLVLTVRALPRVSLPGSLALLAGDVADVAVTLAEPAPAGGVRADLSLETAGIVSVPAFVTVPAGATGASFALTALAGGSTPVRALVQGYAAAALTVTVQGGVVSGVVLGASLAPMEGANVNVNGVTGTTGADGRFLITDVPGTGAGATAVTVRAQDPRTQHQATVGGRLSAPQGYLRGLSLTLAAAGSVAGTVTRADGQTPARQGAVVRLFAASDLGFETALQTASTDGEGRFAFAAVPVGSYALEASDAEGNRGRAACTVAESGQAVAADVAFLGRGTVQGLVRTAAGNPVAGAQIALASRSLFGGRFATATAADGTFAVVGVFVGDFTVSATDPVTGRAASAGGILTADGQVVDVALQVASWGPLVGTVYRADGTTPVAGARVSLGGSASLSTVADDQGRYAFAVVPVGTYPVVATDPPTRGVGSASATVAQGQTATADVTFLPQGTVVVAVRNANDQPVVGASVVVAYYDPVRRYEDSAGAASGADGVAVVPQVLAGSFTATASAGGLTGQERGSVAAGQTATVTVRLEAVGRIVGVVYEPDGATPAAGIRVVASGSSWAEATTGAGGAFSFPGLRMGTYTLYAQESYQLRARAAGLVLAANGQELARNLTLVGLGTVGGRVVTSGGSPAGDFAVTVQSAAPDFGRTAGTRTDAAGYYAVERVPVGAFAVTAGDASQELLGEGSGAISRDGETVTVDILLQNNAITLPQWLYDASDFDYAVQPDGTVQAYRLFSPTVGGTGAGGLELTVGGVRYPFAGGAVATQEDQRREFAVRQQGLGGLNVVRKVYVPADGYFARYLEMVTNPTDAPITADVRATTGFGGYAEWWGSAPHQVSPVATSSGDSAVDGADRWATLDDADPNDPKLCDDFGCNANNVPPTAILWGGAEDPLGAVAVSFAAAAGTSQATLSTAWNQLLLSPGETVGLLHFVVQQSNRGAARASAERLAQLPPEALAGLNMAELAAIRNFAVPADGTSALPALPPLGGRVTGRLLASDGVTAAPAQSLVRLQSTHPIFSRTYQAHNVSSGGTFSFAADSVIKGIPLEPFTLVGRYSTATSWNYWASARPEAPAVAGRFPEGATAVVQDVVFSNTGTIVGRLTWADGAPVAAGATVQVSSSAASGVVTPGADGSFTLGFLLPGGFTGTAEKSPPAGSSGGPLRVAFLAAVAAGETTRVDLALPPVGTIAGVVRDADGARIPSAPVVLFVGTSWYRGTTADASGQYSLPELPEGTYTLKFRDPRTEVELTQPVTVSGGQTAATDVSFPRQGRFAGTLRHRDGTPVGEGFTVTVLDGGSGASLYASGSTGTSEAPGTYRTPYVASNGSLRVRFTHSPMNSSRYTVAEPVTVEEAAPAFASDRQTATLNATLPIDYGSVKVRVWNVDATPYTASGVLVQALRPDDGSVLTSCTIYSTFNGERSCALEYLGVGEAGLRVRATANGASRTADLPGFVSSTTANLVDFTYNFVDRTVSGRVYGADGTTAVSGARVELVRVSDGAVLASTSTSWDGSYSFALVALDPGEAVRVRITYGGATGDRDVDFGAGSTATVNATLPLSSLQGTVYGGDGATGVGDAGVQVVLATDPGAVLASAWTDSYTGYYRTDLFGADDRALLVQVRWPTTGAWGEAGVTLPGAGEVGRRVDFTLPVSVVRGTVYRYGGTAVLAWPWVYATQGAEPNLRTFPSRRYGEGRYDVLGLEPGGFTVTAQDGDTGVWGAVPGTMGADPALPVTVDVTLGPTGTVTGTVGDGGTPVAWARVLLTLDPLGLERREWADRNGVYRFADVPLGAFTLRGGNDGWPPRYAPAVQGSLGTHGETRTVDLDLEPLATVQGTAFRAGGTAPDPAAEVWVRHEDSGWQSSSVRVDGDGRYTLRVPPGPVTVSGRSGAAVGSGSGVARPGEVLAVDLVLDGISLGTYNLDGADGFRYDVQSGASLSNGGTADGRLGDSYDGAYELRVGGTRFSASTGRGELDARQLAVGPQTLSGIQVTRKVFVPAAGGFARYLEVLRNPGAEGGTVSVEVRSNLGSDGSTRIHRGPSDTGATYAVTYDNGRSDPALAHAFAGPGAARPVSSTEFLAGNDRVFYRWDALPVPAGGTTCLLHFAVQREPHDEARAQAQAEALVGLTDPNALVGLTAEERACIVNFAVAP